MSLLVTVMAHDCSPHPSFLHVHSTAVVVQVVSQPQKAPHHAHWVWAPDRIHAKRHQSGPVGTDIMWGKECPHPTTVATFSAHQRATIGTAVVAPVKRVARPAAVPVLVTYKLSAILGLLVVVAKDHLGNWYRAFGSAEPKAVDATRPVFVVIQARNFKSRMAKHTLWTVLAKSRQVVVAGFLLDMPQPALGTVLAETPCIVRTLVPLLVGIDMTIDTL
mmetsp:Transcript_8096/g.24392  ORF Transcript_8096/g.24392 Transcript_8096/m.24392 type:complete len:219 (+) Transcript_8096:607-1263(+)